MGPSEGGNSIFTVARAAAKPDTSDDCVPLLATDNKRQY